MLALAFALSRFADSVDNGRVHGIFCDTMKLGLVTNNRLRSFPALGQFSGK